MTRTSEHGGIIAAIAKSTLAPFGFFRMGTSRVWLAEHGFWLDVVEFQPSSFSKGSYCNVAVHWLWGMTTTLTFDYGTQRIGQFAKFGDAEIFTRQVTDMAAGALQVVARHRVLFESLPATADHLERRELESATVNGWHAFNAGVSLGLTQNGAAARRMFHRVLGSDDRDLEWVVARRRKVERFLEMLEEPDAFRAEIKELIDAHRKRCKLVPLNSFGGAISDFVPS